MYGIQLNLVFSPPPPCNAQTAFPFFGRTTWAPAKTKKKKREMQCLYKQTQIWIRWNVLKDQYLNSWPKMNGWVIRLVVELPFFARFYSYLIVVFVGHCFDSFIKCSEINAWCIIYIDALKFKIVSISKISTIL